MAWELWIILSMQAYLFNDHTCHDLLVVIFCELSVSAYHGKIVFPSLNCLEELTKKSLRRCLFNIQIEIADIGLQIYTVIKIKGKRLPSVFSFKHDLEPK